MRDFLLDVTRPVWRAWRGKVPTGVDRVCLAYVEHFGSRSQAVVQRKGFHFVLSPSHSDRLFELLLSRKPARRFDLARLLTAAAPAALWNRPPPGSLYLNAGHTGLNEPSLPSWVERRRLRAIYFIHDLIPLTHPQFCREGEADKHRRRMENVLASATGVIGNSQATLDELTRFAEGRRLPMPPSVAAWISATPEQPDVERRSLPKPHFVSVGTIEGRKNHQLLLDVWRRLVADLGDDAPLLLIIGQRGWRGEHVFEQLDQPGELKGHVRELGACSDADLAGWIAGARALLMPSFAEGFGLPIVEALRLGTPVIASDLPAFREIAGDIPDYARPTDLDSWERLIRAYVRNSPERARQQARLEGYAAPAWADHFTTVERWLRLLFASRAQRTKFGLNQRDSRLSEGAPGRRKTRVGNGIS